MSGSRRSGRSGRHESSRYARTDNVLHQTPTSSFFSAAETIRPSSSGTASSTQYVTSNWTPSTPSPRRESSPRTYTYEQSSSRRASANLQPASPRSTTSSARSSRILHYEIDSTRPQVTEVYDSGSIYASSPPSVHRRPQRDSGVAVHQDEVASESNSRRTSHTSRRTSRPEQDPPLLPLVTPSTTSRFRTGDYPRDSGYISHNTPVSAGGSSYIPSSESTRSTYHRRGQSSTSTTGRPSASALASHWSSDSSTRDSAVSSRRPSSSAIPGAAPERVRSREGSSSAGATGSRRTSEVPAGYRAPYAESVAESEAPASSSRRAESRAATAATTTLRAQTGDRRRGSPLENLDDRRPARNRTGTEEVVEDEHVARINRLSADAEAVMARDRARHFSDAQAGAYGDEEREIPSTSRRARRDRRQ